MKGARASALGAAVSLVATGLSVTAFAQAQGAPDAGALAVDAQSVIEDSGAATREAGLEVRGDAAFALPPTHSPNCQADALPAGHTVRVETRVEPANPTLGDRVVITYRLTHRSEDRVEFNPDPAAFAQPPIELEYARQQPDRDRSAHAAPQGLVYGEVAVAVQPFKSGDVEVPSQLARLSAAGDVLRVCTPIVRFRVRDPFGNDPHPSPRDVTPPEEVSEDAYRWRYFALALDGVFAVAVSTLGVSAWLRSRPRVAPPPPPPRPSWEIALEALDVLAKSDLLSRGATKDYYDAISDIMRRYVGGYRGFDALEMTTDEVLAALRRDPLPGVAPAELEHLLRECDLVKFARYVPTHEESEKILASAYGIVRRSSPRLVRDRQKSEGGDDTLKKSEESYRAEERDRDGRRA